MGINATVEIYTTLTYPSPDLTKQVPCGLPQVAAPIPSTTHVSTQERQHQCTTSSALGKKQHAYISVVQILDRGYMRR